MLMTQINGCRLLFVEDNYDCTHIPSIEIKQWLVFYVSNGGITTADRLTQRKELMESDVKAASVTVMRCIF